MLGDAGSRLRLESSLVQAVLAGLDVGGSSFASAASGAMPPGKMGSSSSELASAEYLTRGFPDDVSFAHSNCRAVARMRALRGGESLPFGFSQGAANSGSLCLHHRERLESRFG